MKKKVLAGLLAAMMLTAGISGCGAANSDNGTPSTSKTGSESTENGTTEAKEIEEITYAFATFTSVPADVQSVEDALNEITEDKIGVHVNLLILDPANYSQQIALMISSGQDLDIFHTLGDLNSYVASKQIVALDDLLSEYGSDITTIEPEFFMEAGKIEDETYGVPFYMGKALAPTVIFRQDILDELGIDASTITSFETLGDVYEKVHEAHPELKVLSPLNAGDCGMQYLTNQIDYLSEYYNTATGAIIGSGTEVQNYYESEEFEEIVNLARDWYEKGYISSDAATTTMLASAEMSAGTAFSTIGGYAGEIPESQFAGPEGGTLGSARLADPTISTSDVNTLSRVISVNSKHLEAAMKFLNLCYTDAEIPTLLTMGIKDRDYVMTEDGFMNYPEGQNMFTVSYNCFLSAASSNQFIEAPLLVGQSKEDIELQKEENESAWKSDAFGFTFDSSSVKTQSSTVHNVINQYLPGLVCGTLDPDQELDNFRQALKSAGIDEIVTEKQSQLDAWLAK